MSCAELRSAFIKYFVANGHEDVPSSSLVPGNDPTLLFTNAGMVQFKETFLGRESRKIPRAVSSQRCVRAGGKHNDLENVGYTARHHTFFEMLGNFSFGDYFKHDAIHFAWDFLTRELKIPSERLWVTVYETDTEAEEIWLRDIQVDPARFSRLGAASNFWSMGDVGPCGPCTEIFYDHGPTVAGGPPGTPDEDGDRYVEIWNLVFMQYDRSGDGALSDLPHPSVDTGMGLERLAAVMQGVHNNYEIDLFQALVEAVGRLAGCDDLSNSSLRVIADHIRSCSFLIVDGVLPSNEGRGYVLRRIIRRAIRHGYQLGIHDVFFHKLVKPLCGQMGAAFTELTESRARVESVLQKEEQRFVETLDQGMKILEACVAQLDGDDIPGETVFLLYDTYGFPVDLTADFAREKGLGIDRAGFDREMDAQKQRARAASRFQPADESAIDLDLESEFCGYDGLNGEARIMALLKGPDSTDALAADDSGSVVLDRTPFYAESGGQVGDSGVIRSSAGAVFEVRDTRKLAGGAIIHHGVIRSGTMHAGDTCCAEVDNRIRQATALNHSATHLLHAALRQLLGDHVTQKGSLVNSDRLRFDFAHFSPLDDRELVDVEALVNRQIRSNSAVSARVMARDEAMKAGAMALFGEKYGDQVRVLSIGDFSVELCGGTHVTRAGDIGFFKIVAETGVAAGVRRIEAITGDAAVAWVENSERIISRVSAQLKGGRDNIAEKVGQMLDRNRQLEKQIERLKSRLANSAGGDLSSTAVDVLGVKVLAAKLDDVDVKSMRETIDRLKNKLGRAVVLLATVDGVKITLIAGVTSDLVADLRAGDLVKEIAGMVGGKGGGRPDLAQGGGNRPADLDGALESVSDWVRIRLNAKV